MNPDNQNQVYYCSGWFPDTSRLNPPIRRVIVLPKPEVDFDVPEIACLKEALDLQSDADPKYTKFNWRIENDSFSTENPDTFYYFPSTGKYRIWFTPEYAADSIYHIGCFDSAFRDIQVTDITAKFGKQKGVQCNAFVFYDSSGGVSRKWTFSVPGKDLGQSDAQNPSFDFRTEKGVATVCLEATDSQGCTNVYCDTVQLLDNAFELIMPNVFTPGVDGKNDIFDILIKNYEFYKLTIYNRWGEIVYLSSTDGIRNDLINWNGNYMNGPNPLPEGAYFYILETKELCDPNAEPRHISGTITLIREH